MKRLSPFLFFLIFFPHVCALAYTPKEGNVTATLGPYFYRTKFSYPGSDVKISTLGGVGLMANGDFSDHESLEVAMFHLRNRFYQQSESFFVGEESEMISLTMGYRRWLNPYISWSLGIYSSYTMGEPRVIHQDPGIDPTLTTSARDTTEYGVDFSIQAELWSRDRIGVLADLRYSSSLTNRPGEQGDHYGIILGVKYFIQGKDPTPDPKPFSEPESGPLKN